jgi:hypothetical protein
MDESRIDDISQVSHEVNTVLTSPYSEDEVKKSVFQMEHNKVSHLDGFSTEFYRNFWEIIKVDLMELFSMLHVGQLQLFHINFGEIFRKNSAVQTQTHMSLKC